MDLDVGAFFTLAFFMFLPAVVVVFIYSMFFLQRGKRKRQRITSRSGRHRSEHKKEDEEADKKS